MTDIATAVYELMGRSTETQTAGPDPDKIKDKVEKVFMVSMKCHFVEFVRFLVFVPISMSFEISFVRDLLGR